MASRMLSHAYLDVLHGVPFFVIESELDGGMVSTARAVAQSLVKETYTPWRGFELYEPHPKKRSMRP